MLPREWTAVMRVLQDRCNPTPYEDLERLFLTDMGQDIQEIFDDFDPNPIGVASLAQVHVGRYKKTGQLVAVKVSQCVLSAPLILTPPNLQLQHPHLAEFSEIDMETVEVAMGLSASMPARANAYAVHLRLGQTLVPGIRVHLARRGDAGKPTKGNGFCA